MQWGNFLQLCRQNDISDNFKDFGSFEPSIKAFDNISGMTFSHEYHVIKAFNCLHSNRKCAKRMEISGCKMNEIAPYKKTHVLVSA